MAESSQTQLEILIKAIADVRGITLTNEEMAQLQAQTERLFTATRQYAAANEEAGASAESLADAELADLEARNEQIIASTERMTAATMKNAAAEEEAGKVYGRAGHLGHLLRNFGVDENIAITGVMGLMFGMEAKRQIDEYAKKLDEASEKSEQFTRSMAEQRKMAEQKIALAQNEEGLLSAQVEIQEKIAEAERKRTEATEKGDRAEVERQGEIIGQLEFIQRHTTEIQQRSSDILSIDQQRAIENQKIVDSLQSQIDALNAAMKGAEELNNRLKENFSEADQLRSAQDKEKLLRIEAAEKSGTMSHVEAERQRQAIKNAEDEAKFQEEQTALRVKRDDAIANRETAAATAQQAGLKANETGQEWRDTIAAAGKAGGDEKITLSKRADELKSEYEQQQKIADEAHRQFNAAADTADELQKQIDFQKKLHDQESKNTSLSDVSALKDAGGRDKAAAEKHWQEMLKNPDSPETISAIIAAVKNSIGQNPGSASAGGVAYEEVISAVQNLQQQHGGEPAIDRLMKALHSFAQTSSAKHDATDAKVNAVIDKVNQLETHLRNNT